MTQPDWRTLLERAELPATQLPHATNQHVVKPHACGAVRTILAGGQLMQLINHPSVTSMERLFRKYPLPGAFTATPSRPFTFELGALLVPSQMVLVLLDYRFAIYEPSGVVVGDTEELEDRRLSTSVGYQLLFDEKRSDNINYELTPSNPTQNTQTFEAYNNPGIIPGEGLSQPTQATFDRLRSANTRASVSSGASTLPQRHRRDAQLAMPFTYIVNAGQQVNLRVTIFQGIPMPVSFFEGELSGMLTSANALARFIKEITPCKDPNT